MLATFTPYFPIHSGDPAFFPQGYPHGLLKNIYGLGAYRGGIALHSALDGRNDSVRNAHIHLDFHGVNVILESPEKP